GLASGLEDRETGTWQYSLSEPAPHSYVAERVLAAPDADSALERLADPSFRSGRDVVRVGPSRPEQRVAGGELRDLAAGGTQIRADVVLPVDGLWVVTDTWFPGWEATIDGVGAEIVPVNGIHRGV